MSDFLTNLAARAIAPPSLRPRTRSRYEPEVEEGFRSAVATPPLSVSPIPSVAAVPSAPPPPKAVANATALRNRHEEQQPSEPETKIETRLQVHREVEHDVQRVVETQERVIRVPHVEHEREEVEVIKHRFETQPPKVIREPGTNTIREKQVKTTVDRKPRVIERERQIEQAPQEPTIHVSIGRVEVRAVQQSTAPKPAARGPKMTIDDYVERRKTKERR